MNIPTSRADLAGATCIAEVTSEAPDKTVWTVLSIWYRQDPGRPFVAVVEGRVADPERQGMIPRFRAAAFGTIDRAYAWFDPSNLRDDLIIALPPPGKLAALYPDGNAIRMREADERRAQRGYQGGVMLFDALTWLYPDLAAASDNAIATRFEADFGIGSRTARGILSSERVGGDPPTWVTAFIRALRFFDRKAWEMNRG